MAIVVTSIYLALRDIGVACEELRYDEHDDLVMDAKGRVVSSTFLLARNPLRAIEPYRDSILIFDGRLKVAL